MDRIRLLNEPDYVPTRWLVTLFVAAASAILSAVSVGIWLQGVDSRIQANELKVDAVIAEMKYNSQTVQQKFLDRLDQIDHRLSVIEGRLAK